MSPCQSSSHYNERAVSQSVSLDIEPLFGLMTRCYCVFRL